MKQVLIISVPSNLKTDARVKRQLSFLKNQKHKITLICYDAETDNSIHVIKIDPPRLTLAKKMVLGFLLYIKLYSLAYQVILWPWRKLNISGKFDFIVANDIESLPLAFQMKGSAKIIFDAHEYAPRHFEDKLIWRIFFQGFNKFLCKKYIPLVDSMITIGDGIANEYEKNYHIKPVVITNAAHFFILVTSSRRMQGIMKYDWCIRGSQPLQEN